MIAVIDYGAGNLRSVVNAFEAIGQKPLVTRHPADLAKASAIVLPGVGAFGEGMEALQRLNLIDALTEQVLGYQKPYLGICLGLQFLAQESFEHGTYQGLGWINGTVRRIVPQGSQYRVPHIGWNDIRLERPCPLFEGLEAEPVFYFVHSYHLVENRFRIQGGGRGDLLAWDHHYRWHLERQYLWSTVPSGEKSTERIEVA